MANAKKRTARSSNLSRGAVALRTRTERTSQVDLAAALAKRMRAPVTQSAVSRWCSGTHVPSARAQLAMQAALGIRAAWWYEPAPRAKR